MRKKKYSITINNKTYGLLSPYAIPGALATDYCNNDVVLNTPEGTSYISQSDQCFFCSRHYTEATRPCRLMCPDLNINKKLGRVGVLCCDCNYWLLARDGYDSIPKSIKKFLDTGFIPANLSLYS